MKQISKAAAIKSAEIHSTGNKREIESSKYAGCLSCRMVFDANKIRDWKDEWISPQTQNRAKRWTAKCPQCGETSVIGSSTGLLDDQAYLVIVGGWVAEAKKG